MKLLEGLGVYIETNILTFHKWMGDWYKNQQDLSTDQVRSSQNLIFFGQKWVPHPLKKVSKTVWTFAKKKLKWVKRLKTFTHAPAIIQKIMEEIHYPFIALFLFVVNSLTYRWLNFFLIILFQLNVTWFILWVP